MGNNQKIIKYLGKKSGIYGYWYKLEEQKQKDAEITDLYNRGYFTPYEYNDYMERLLSYQYMIDLFSSRMNNMYYFPYVEYWYNEGYLDYDRYIDYLDKFYRFYFEGDLSYDAYISKLEQTLKRINYNILHGIIYPPYEPEEPEEDEPDYPDEPEE